MKKPRLLDSSRREQRAQKKEKIIKDNKLVTMTVEQIITYNRAHPTTVPDFRDDQIDFSDIPEMTDEELKRMRPLYPELYGRGRPRLSVLPRKLISIKLDPFLLERLKRRAKAKGTKYQSLIHKILEDYMKKVS